MSAVSVGLPGEALEALRNGERMLERTQSESFFLTRNISKMRPQVIETAAERIADALLASNDVDVASVLGQTVTQTLAEPIAAIRNCIEQTRSTLAAAMHVVGSAAGGAVADELPKTAGMPMLDVSELTRDVVIERPALLSLLGKNVLKSHLRRKLEVDRDRALLEFLSLYANRLRRWMEQSLNAFRTAFGAFADLHRAGSEDTLLEASSDVAAIQNDLQLLRDWGKTTDFATHV